MYKYLSFFLVLFLFSSCNPSKNLKSEKESFHYSFSDEKLAYTFHIQRNGRVEFQAEKGLSAKGKKKFNLDEGAMAGIWSIIDGLELDFGPEVDLKIDPAESTKSVEYMLIRKQGSFSYTSSPKGFAELETIFGALLNHPSIKE